MTKLRRVADYAEAAKAILPSALWDTLLGDYGDELWQTNTNNMDGFTNAKLRPRVLVDVSYPKVSTQVLGTQVNLPILIAPSGAHQRYHVDGELATARAAARAGTVMALSTVSTFSIEEVAEASNADLWFQIYLFRDRRITERLIRRVEDAGYRALVLTVDVPGTQSQERDVRFLQRGYKFGDEAATAPTIDPARILRNFQDEQLANFQLPTPAGLTAFFDSTFTWSDLDSIRQMTRLPLIIKGVQCAQDAYRCRESGIDGIIVSNHGGFAIPNARASIDVLPEVVESAGSVEVYVDGGIRTGSDVLKCLAAGARAVLIGRAQIWGLAVDGEDGIVDVLDVLRTELDQAMRLCGCNDVSAVDPALMAGIPSRPGIASDLAELARLFDRGLLSADEFSTAKSATIQCYTHIRD